MKARSASARQEEIAFHKQMVRRLKREISQIDRNSRRKYLREFDEEYRGYSEAASFDDLIVAAYKADIVYLGDYHALPQSQHFIARLVEAIAARSRHVHVGVEMVFGRYQRVLERWLKGEIDDPEFLKRIRYHQEWGYDWASFRQILAVARARDLPVLAIDCEPRNGFRFIRRRDRYAARRIVGALEKDPLAKVVVVFGESHLAATHLPARVRELLRSRNLERRDLVVVQNVEKIYWQLADAGAPQEDVVKCGENRFCAFTASPLAKYEAYRQTLDRWSTEGAGSEEQDLDLTPTLYTMIDTILRFLRVDKYRCPSAGASGATDFLVDLYPEVYSDVDLREFRQLLKASGFDKREVEEVNYHVRRNGSCFLPRLNAIYIGQFNLVHGGEEAAHFVNMALKGELYEHGARSYPRPDLFYVAVMEEALGFFGSKLIDPRRNHFFETEFYRYYKKSPEVIERETGYKHAQFCQIIDFILLHKRFERGYETYPEVPKALLEGIHGVEHFNVLTHEIGYFLGQQLYDGYHGGRIRRDEIQALFRRRFHPGGDALSVYLDLVAQLDLDAARS